MIAKRYARKRGTVPKLVQVTWETARAGAVCECRSVGWLMGRTLGPGLVLIQTFAQDGRRTDAITIPGGAVRRIRNLR